MWFILLVTAFKALLKMKNIATKDRIKIVKYKLLLKYHQIRLNKKNTLGKLNQAEKSNEIRR